MLLGIMKLNARTQRKVEIFMKNELTIEDCLKTLENECEFVQINDGKAVIVNENIPTKPTKAE